MELEWNRGGWLGGQLGGSAWMLVAGLLTLPKDIPVALAVLGLFGAANLVGYALWRRRDMLSAYTATQMLLPALGVCGLAAIYALDRARLFEAIQIGGSVSAGAMYGVIILVVLAVMLMFHIRFGRHKDGP